MQWCSLILFACQWHVSDRNGGADICRETEWSSLSGAHPEKGEHSELGSHCWRKRQCGAPGASEEGAIKPFVTNGVNPTYLKNCFLLPGPYKHRFSWYQLINIRNTKSLFVCMIFSHTHTHTPKSLQSKLQFHSAVGSRPFSSGTSFPLVVSVHLDWEEWPELTPHSSSPLAHAAQL